jgi:ABC-2 type transport system permease protein
VIADIGTVMWKEWKELMSGRGLRSGRITILIMIICFGVVLPLQFGDAMVKSPAVLLVWAWVPPFLAIQVVADSFAGERERHTLETLLASRLADRAILFGKIATSVSYGWGLTMICLLVGLVTLNLVSSGGRAMGYSVEVWAGIICFTLLTSGMTANLGVLLSLRAASVRHVQQMLSIGWMVLIFGIGYGARFIIGLLPRETAARILSWFSVAGSGHGLALLIALFTVVMLIANAALIGLAMVRFRRARLILD